jgi:hypothetical protein
MAKREKLSTFIKNFIRLPTETQRMTIGDWNANTLLAMSLAQKYSPLKTGQLQGSARMLKAKVTPQGIESSFIFAVPYAYRMEKWTGNINQSINPFAQAGYAKRGVEEQEPFFILDLKKTIGKVFNKL